MKQITYICSKCHLPIKGTVYRIFAGIVDVKTDEIADNGTLYLDKVDEAEICGVCLSQVDEQIAKMFSKGSRSVSSGRKATIKLDMEKVIDLRNKGYNLEFIAKQFNCSPQTIQNRLIKCGYYEQKKFEKIMEENNNE